MSGPRRKHEVAQTSATSSGTTEDDKIGAHLKTWFSMESKAMPLNVSGRSRENVRAPEQLAKTTRLVQGRYKVGLSWAENIAIFQNN